MVIVLLAADQADARRHRDNAPPGETVVWIIEAAEVRADIIEAGARIHRTDLWPYNSRVVAALAALHRRIGLVDPTGLLGPIEQSPGARTREPFGTPPVGTVMTGTKQRHPRDHRNLGTQL